MSATEYAIGRHCGVTFAGLKIASLVSLRKGEEDVIQTLSRRFAGKGFAFILLREDEERLLVYVCHRARLTKYLFSSDVRAFLARFGYEYGSAEEALEQLKYRMHGEFPHEIGIFLGYPLADVRGFLRDPNSCVLCATRTAAFCAAAGRCMKTPMRRRERSSGSAAAAPVSAGIWTEGGRSHRFLI